MKILSQIIVKSASSCIFNPNCLNNKYLKKLSVKPNNVIKHVIIIFSNLLREFRAHRARGF